MHRHTIRLAVLVGLCWAAAAQGGEVFEREIKAGRTALSTGKLDQALEHFAKAIADEPENPQGYTDRAAAYMRHRRHEDAIRDLTQVLKLEPTNADIYDLRGSERLAAGDVTGSIEDFDKAVALEPQRARSHWKRGIAYYYAERFDDGKKQFEAYQTFDDADVENAAWRYLCMARKSGVETAQREILKVGDDRRVPMRQIYDLYAGKARPEDVLAACRAGNPDAATLNNRLFYAHQYLGLYYEVLGDKARAAEHTLKAANDHPIGHYMWDVARMHADRLKPNEPQE